MKSMANRATSMVKGEASTSRLVFRQITDPNRYLLSEYEDVDFHITYLYGSELDGMIDSSCT